MNKMDFGEYTVFFDDGGVMNDNRLRGIQWQKMIGEYFPPKYGGEPHKWIEANIRVITDLSNEHTILIEESLDVEFNLFYDEFIYRWISEMFEYAGVDTPPKNQHREIYFDVINWVTPNVKAAFPGVVDSIKKLHNMGFQLYTASAEHSLELKGYLQGMRVKECFLDFYGPDLINTHKTSEKFYEKMFNEIGISPKKAIIVDDNPRCLEYAKKLDAKIIQVCLTGEYEPAYKYYVEQMNDLPEIILKTIKNKK